MAKTYKFLNGPTLGEKAYVELKKHIIERLDYAKNKRDAMTPRFAAIDKLYHGHRNLSEDDRKRVAEMLNGTSTKPTRNNIGFGAAHIDNAVTNMLIMFYENIGLYQAVAEKEHANGARAFTELMNKHAADFGHVSQLVLFLQHALKYDWGGLAIDWIVETGRKPESGLDGGVSFSDSVLRKGNRLTALDPYNTFTDPTIDNIMDVPTHGEYFAMAKIVNKFAIERMLNVGEIIETDNFLTEEKFGEVAYFQKKPALENTIADEHHGSDESWDDIFVEGGSPNTHLPGTQRMVEKVDYIGWVPNRLITPIAKSNEKYAVTMLQITIIGGEHIVAIKPLEYQHRQLPCAFAKPMYDAPGLKTRSQFELIAPLQIDANFQMDVGVESKRAAIYDRIFIDGRAIGDKNPEDVGRERVTVVDKHFLKDKRLSDALHIVQHKPIDRTAEAVNSATELMEFLVPTGRVEQVADLQRATTYQTAAVVQSSNKRQYKQAVVIRDQALRIATMQMYYNIIQHEQKIEIITDEGERIEATTKEFVDAGIQYKIGEGLKGLDRLRVESFWKEIVNTVIQNAQALQRVDIIKLLNHVSNIAGDGQDLNQFLVESPIDTLPPELKQKAFELLQAQESEEESV